ncbi:MAG TPA: PLP-dependent aspartate aminotransferase family protein, partial [Inquilinus sp.]|nr:PLP-dependent aspartate aminotransferase family protein [Inquilinus sp.]
WSLRNWLMTEATRWGLKVELVDTHDIDAVRAALRPGETRLVWLETPANPMWNITDIEAVAEAAHGAGARVAVDSTVATPVLTRPLALGADLVMHSATKYLNGHSDVIAGALATARDDEQWQRIKRIRAQLGGILGPFESWLLLRGMRTLVPRVRQASASAMAIAEHFHGHPLVSAVLYPGLPSADGHAIAARQMQGGFGGMLSIRVRGGAAAAIGTAARVELWKRATSLGGVESLIEHRSSIEGPTSPVPDDLLRLSAGIEDPSELIADLEQALKAATA